MLLCIYAAGQQGAENLLRLAIQRWKAPQNAHVLACTLRFFDAFRLVLPSLMTVFSSLPKGFVTLAVRRYTCAPRISYSNAEIAQLVEQLIRNQQVGGSIPLLGTISLVLRHSLLTLAPGPPPCHAQHGKGELVGVSYLVLRMQENPL